MYPDKAYKLTFDMKTNGLPGLIGTKRVIIKNMVKETKVEETSYWLILSSKEGKEYLYDGDNLIPMEYEWESFDTNTFEDEEEWKPLEGFENNIIN